MKSINPKNEYVPLRINLSLRRDTLRLISEISLIVSLLRERLILNGTYSF